MRLFASLMVALSLVAMPMAANAALTEYTPAAIEAEIEAQFAALGGNEATTEGQKALLMARAILNVQIEASSKFPQQYNANPAVFQTAANNARQDVLGADSSLSLARQGNVFSVTVTSPSSGGGQTASGS